MASVFSVMAKVSADTSQFVSGVKKAEQATKDLEVASGKASNGVDANFGKMDKSVNGFSGLLKKAGGALLAFGAIDFIGGAVTAASSLEAEFEGVNQTFGESAKVVQDFAKTASTTVGMSEVAALKAAKGLGAYGRAAGLSAQQNATFSTTMVQAAGDLGSFYDVSSEDAMSAISMGLRGEMEGLRKFGILLDDSTIRQQAMKDGIIQTTNQALTPQQKTLATYNAILAGMGPATGDFVKYGDSFGNSIKTMGALMENLKATVGGALLEPLAKLTQALSPVIEALGPILSKVMEALVPIITAVTDNIGLLLPVLTPILDMVGLVGGVFAELINTILPPLLTILAPLMELFASLQEPIANLVMTILPPLANILTIVANSIVGLLPSLQPVIDTFTELATLLGGYLAEALTMLAPYIQDFMGVIGELVGAMAPLIPPLLQIVMDLLPPMFNLFKALMPPIMMIAKLIIKLLIPVMLLLMKVLTPVIKFIGDVIGFVVQKIADFINWLWPYVEPVVNAIIDGINHVLSFLGMEKIGKLAPANKKEAYDQGKELGEAKTQGELDALGTGGLDGSGDKDGSKKEDPMKKIREEAKKLLSGFQPVIKSLKEVGEQEKKVMDTSDALKAKIQEALKVKGISKKQAESLTAMLKSQTTKLRKIAKERDEIAKKIEARKDFAKKITDNLLGKVKVTDLGGSTASIIDNLKNRIQQFKDYSATLSKLREMGASDDVFKQIAEAGIDAGGATARALVSGGAEAIAQINALSAEAQATATSVGKIAGDEMYNAGIDMATGLIKGLEAKDAELVKAAKSLAGTLTAEVKKALGIHSPSKVFAGIGSNIGAGMELGINQSIPNVNGAIESMIPTASSISLPISGSTGGTVNSYEITVNAGMGANGADIGKAVVETIRKYERQNGPVWKSA